MDLQKKRRVVVPYTEIHPLVKKVLDKEKPEYIAMTDVESYWRLLCDIWAGQDDVVMIEHDIIPWPGAIDELWRCPSAWCTYTYEMREGFGIHHAFGCVKLGTKLFEELPDVWKNVATTSWRHLDAQLCDYAQRHAIIPHPHRPPVIHLHGMDIYKELYDEENEVKDPEQKPREGTEIVFKRKGQVA
jgi:hypothetical protein